MVIFWQGGEGQYKRKWTSPHLPVTFTFFCSNLHSPCHRYHRFVLTVNYLPLKQILYMFLILWTVQKQRLTLTVLCYLIDWMYMSVCSYSQMCFSYTDLCCTENDAYKIVNHGKVVYEEIANWRSPHNWKFQGTFWMI